MLEENNAADPEIVFDQNPKSGERVDKDSEVTIKVSTGASKVSVPNVVGKSRRRGGVHPEGRRLQVLIEDRGRRRRPSERP